MKSLKRVALAASVFVLALVPALMAMAAAGDLDPAFAADGYAIYPFGGYSIGIGLALDPSGGGVAVGQGPSGAAAIRFDAAGDLVPTFLDAGQGDPLASRYGQSTLFDVVIDGEDKFLTVGTATHAAGSTFVARLEADGALDGSYGDSGVVELPLDLTVPSIAIDSAGRAVVAGRLGSNGLTVARVGSEGTLDTTFGDDGFVTLNFGFEAGATGLTVDTLDRVVVSGWSDLTAIVVRFGDEGSLDPTFAEDGVFTAVAPFDGEGLMASDVVVDASGAVYAVGDMSGVPAIIGLETSGEPLSGFRDGGLVVDIDLVTDDDSPSWFIAERVALDGRGGIVATGIGDDAEAPINLRVVRYTLDGSRDSDFGTNGAALSPVTGDAGIGYGLDIGVGADGAITVVGQLVTPYDEFGWTDDLAVVRYSPANPLSTSTSSSSSSSTTSSTSVSSTSTTVVGVTTTTGPASTVPPVVGGVFSDDDGSVFESDIEWLAGSGITSGCNPPANDRFCPDDSVTRGQMAAFLVRGLGLSASGSFEFVDDDGSVFESDIERLAEAGVTMGCNPPANTEFCPEDVVTRGQMAAFLRRALPGLAVGASPSFGDIAGSVFVSDIEWLAATGVTSGCTPVLFCPDDPVTRGQMAAFLHRALGG